MKYISFNEDAIEIKSEFDAVIFVNGTRVPARVYHCVEFANLSDFNSYCESYTIAIGNLSGYVYFWSDATNDWELLENHEIYLMSDEANRAQSIVELEARVHRINLMKENMLNKLHAGEPVPVKKEEHIVAYFEHIKKNIQKQLESYK